ncbi:MAG: IS110 family transposase [Pseudomonadota bacterium]
MNKLSTVASNGGAENVVTVLGIDLAKNVFALHGVNAFGKVVLARPNVRRDQLLDVLAKLPPCMIGMEACSGAHHWARALIALGHTAKLMAPKFVSPYRIQGKRGKNDANDAAAICEAVTRPHMRFVPVKSEDAQATLTVHRVRQGFIEERTATINRVRGLMSEFGIVLPQRARTVRRCAHEVLENLPGWAKRAVDDLLAHVTVLDERIDEYDTHLSQMARADERSKRLMQIPGIGPTTATALLAAIGNGHDFKNGRQLAAWLGLVPGQHGSGGATRLGRITKAGDRYIRTLLILGARAVLAAAANKGDRISRWGMLLYSRIGYGKTLVAIAAKNARMAWAMLAKAEAFAPLT